MSSWFKWPRLTRGDLVAPVAQTTNYNRRAPNANAWFHYEERPPFSILTAEMMLLDPKVTLALAIRNGLIAQAEVEFVGGNPAVCAFVARMWKRIWGRCAARILETKHLGYQGFEVMFSEGVEEDAGYPVFQDLKDFHPRDVRPLIAIGRAVGLTVGSVRHVSQGRVPLWNPKGLWLTFRDRYSNFYGQALLEKAFPSWHEKYQKGGAIKLRKLRMMKDAWIGDRIRYPSTKTILPDGTEVSWKDVAREIVEMRQSGGVFGLPSETYPDGTPKWDYVPPTSVEGASQIFEYKKELDSEIFESLEVIEEIVKASEGGGNSFSGRSIPLITCLAVYQTEFEDYVRQIDRQIIRPLARIRFGIEPTYQAEPRSLIESISQLMGGGGNEAGTAGQQQSSGVPGMRGGMMPNRGGPQMQSGARYGELQFSGAVQNLAHVYREGTSPIQSPAPYGSTVGGVYFAPGDWISPAQQTFANPTELRALGIEQAAEPKLYEFSTTHFDLPHDLAERVIGLAAQIHPDDLRDGPVDQAVELRPHVTIRYGLKTDDVDEIRAAVAEFGPIAIRFGDVSIFEGGETDVVKIEIESRGLVKLNEALGDAIAHVDTFPTYQPHVTIAYVKKGLGKNYVEKLNSLSGTVAAFNRLTFGRRDRSKITVPLTGRIMQFSSLQLDDAGRWITIGAKSNGEGKRKGGFPCQIDKDGTILKGGPAGLRGKNVSEIGKYFDEQKASKSREFDEKNPIGKTRSYGTIVNYQAEKWGMKPSDYSDFADQIWEEKATEHKEREDAKAHARKRLKLTAGDISKLENDGFDHGSRHAKIRGLDTVAREMASMYPSLGWGEGYGDEEGRDLGANIWELIREGKIDAPSRVSKEFHDEVDSYLENELRKHGNRGGGSKPPSDWDDVQFSGGGGKRLRAAKGGQTIKGTFYRGGLFIPAAVVESLTPAEKKAVAAGKPIPGKVARGESAAPAGGGAKKKPESLSRVVAEVAVDVRVIVKLLANGDASAAAVQLAESTIDAGAPIASVKRAARKAAKQAQESGANPDLPKPKKTKKAPIAPAITETVERASAKAMKRAWNVFKNPKMGYGDFRSALTDAWAEIRGELMIVDTDEEAPAQDPPREEPAQETPQADPPIEATGGEQVNDGRESDELQVDDDDEGDEIEILPDDEPIDDAPPARRVRYKPEAQEVLARIALSEFSRNAAAYGRGGTYAQLSDEEPHDGESLTDVEREIVALMEKLKTVEPGEAKDDVVTDLIASFAEWHDPE